MSAAGGEAIYRARMPESAGGHVLCIRKLRVQEKLDVEASFKAAKGTGGDPLAGLYDRTLKATTALHVRTLASVDGVELAAGSAEQEAAYHALGVKGAELLALAYDRLHAPTQEEADAFLADLKAL